MPTRCSERDMRIARCGGECIHIETIWYEAWRPQRDIQASVSPTVRARAKWGVRGAHAPPLRGEGAGAGEVVDRGGERAAVARGVREVVADQHLARVEVGRAAERCGHPHRP